MVNLLPEEEEYLSDPRRCEACNHLEVLHNEHCCPFCMIEGCNCEWGEITE